MYIQKLRSQAFFSLVNACRRDPHYKRDPVDHEGMVEKQYQKYCLIILSR